MPVALFPHTPLIFTSIPLLLCYGVSCSTFLAFRDEGGGKEIVRVCVWGVFDVEVTSMQNTTCYHYLVLLPLLLLGLPLTLPANTALLVQLSIAGFSY